MSVSYETLLKGTRITDADGAVEAALAASSVLPRPLPPHTPFLFMHTNRRETPAEPTLLNGKTARDLMDEYVLTERQVEHTIDYT